MLSIWEYTMNVSWRGYTKWIVHPINAFELWLSLLSAQKQQHPKEWKGQLEKKLVNALKFIMET